MVEESQILDGKTLAKGCTHVKGDPLRIPTSLSGMMYEAEMDGLVIEVDEEDS